MKFLLVLCTAFSISISGYAQQLQSILGESWQLQHWVNSALTQYTYDSNGYLISTINQQWDKPTLNWIKTNQHDFVNNSNGTVQQTTLTSKNPFTGLWQNVYRYTYTYLPTGVVDFYTIEPWVAGTWELDSKKQYVYDNNGYLIALFTPSWISGANYWENKFKYDYINNNNGTVQQTIWSEWISATSVWVPYLQVIYTYTPANQIQTLMIQLWMNGSWANTSFITYSYDSSNYQTNEISQSWDSNLGSWKNNTQSTLLHNSTWLIQNKITQIWDNDSSKWDISFRDTYNYSTVTALPVAMSREVKLYPNPASSLLILETYTGIYSNFSILDLQGRTVLTQSLTADHTRIDISKLSGGIYIVKLESDVKTHFQKFIKLE